jgi:hypothetical protein
MTATPGDACKAESGKRIRLQHQAVNTESTLPMVSAILAKPWNMHKKSHRKPEASHKPRGPTCCAAHGVLLCQTTRSLLSLRSRCLQDPLSAMQLILFERLLSQKYLDFILFFSFLLFSCTRVPFGQAAFYRQSSTPPLQCHVLVSWLLFWPRPRRRTIVAHESRSIIP